MDFPIKIRRKKVLHLFLPLFVEKSYFTLAMILDFAIPPLHPSPPPHKPHRHFMTFYTG